MADILIYSGDGSAPREQAAIATGQPVQSLADRLGLKADQWITPPDEPPFINRQTGGWAEEKDHYVLVRVAAGEGGWQAGYYLLPITAPAAYRALGIAHPDTAEA